MSVTNARTVMTRRLGKVESHFICKLAIGLFQISVLLILGMAIIEVTVDADHLTGQVSFNFPVVCKSVLLLLLLILCRAGSSAAYSHTGGF